MSPSQRPKCSVLYIDNSADDHFLFQCAVVKSETPLHIQPFFSGEPAIAYLKDQAPFAGLSVYPYPSFVLYDHDPGSSKGDNLTSAVRAFHPSAGLPIIILSDSADDTSVANSYQTGVDHFVRKPTTSTRLAIIVQTLYDCAMSNPRDFNALTRLPEYEPRPAASRAAKPASPRPITSP